MQCISSNCRGGNVILSSKASSAIAFDSGKVTILGRFNTDDDSVCSEDVSAGPVKGHKSSGFMHHSMDARV